ncbi:MAG: glycosyltransferase family 4 protein, partial [Candidatus Binatia bacterium]
TEPRIAFVTHRFRHHAPSSGYDRVLDTIPGERLDPGLLIRLARPLPDRIFSWIRRASGMELYGRPRCLHEIRATLPFLFGARRVFHFVYADNAFRYLGRLPNLHGHRIVATYHRPPSVLERSIRDPRFLQTLDHVIILGESQREFFRRHLDESRITMIPHGIDCDFFSPGPLEAREKRCLFVGHYLRDFELFRAAVRALVHRQPDARVTVVARPRFVAEFDFLPNTEVVTEIPETELRALYRRSSVLLLPLIDAVANNTILEAIACGLPVVTTAVGSVGDYLQGDAGVAVPAGDAERLSDAASRYLTDHELLARASRAARDLAVGRFELGKIAARLRETLSEVASRPVRDV